MLTVVPLAAESLGVRSMATYVECGDTRLLVDPGASLAPQRHGLPPAEAEWEALRRANDRILGYGTRAGLVVLSHYHEDHVRYDPALYAGRGVWAREPARLGEPGQQERARRLWQALQGRCRLAAADGARYQTPDCELRLSPPLPHGLEGSPLGYVTALTVIDRRDGQRFVHASDVLGPLSAVATGYLLRERPRLLYLAGPPSYLEDRLGRALIDRGVENLRRILDHCDCRVILDHHALRDPGWRERFAALWETGRVTTAAGFLGRAEEPLEVQRRRLWAEQRRPAAPMPARRAPARPPLSRSRRLAGP